jgi:hypothetical protein
MGGIRAVRGPARLPWTIALLFAAAHLALLLSSRVVDGRYLLPVLPVLCIVTAAALISGVSVLRRYEFRRGVRTALVVVLTCAVVGPALVSSITFDRDLSKTSTEDLAFAWIREHVPPTAVVVVEGNALSIPRGVVVGRGVAELRQTTFDQLAGEDVNYVVASSAVFGKYLEQPRVYRDEYLAYTRLFSEAREVARFSPSRANPGPELRILQVVP